MTLATLVKTVCRKCQLVVYKISNVFIFVLFLDSKKILKATCDSLILGHMCSKESVTESDTQQAKRLTLSRPRDFISSSAKPSDCNKACDASGNHTTVTASQQNPSSSQNHQAPVVMQTKNSSSGTHPHKAQDPHKAQTDDVTLNHTVNDLLVHDGATSEERNDSVNQNRRVLLESEELGGKDKYVLYCDVFLHESIAKLPLTVVKYDCVA